MLPNIDYLVWVRRWLWLVLLGTLLGGGIAFGIAATTAPTYQSSATLLINASSTPNALTYTDVLLSQQLTLTYSKIAVQDPVLAQVIQEGHLPFTVIQLQKMVSAAPVLQTQLITITANTHDAKQAATIANLVANVFITQQHDRMAKGDASNAVSVVAPAQVPASPVSPRVKLDTVLGMVVGLLAAVGFIALVTYFDDTIKSHNDVDRALQLPVLGLVQRNVGQAVVTVGADSVAQDRHSAEVFRVVRANLGFATASYRSKILLVTSTQKAEGKTTTIAKLAVALAEAGKRVVLVDADLRLSSLHRMFKLDNRRGLSNLLVDPVASPAELLPYLQQTPLPTLRVLTAGVMPPNPTELLQSENMATLLAMLAELADVVLIDSPPVLAVADAMTIAPNVQGILFIIESGSIRLGRLNEALGRLRRSGTPILGVILNKVKADTEGYYYYAYDGYYSSSGKPATEHVNGVIEVVEHGAAPVGDGKSGSRRQG
jgi:capsular exopolysaccharide synthesis family protein